MITLGQRDDMSVINMMRKNNHPFLLLTNQCQPIHCSVQLFQQINWKNLPQLQKCQPMALHDECHPCAASQHLWHDCLYNMYKQKSNSRRRLLMENSLLYGIWKLQVTLWNHVATPSNGWTRSSTEATGKRILRRSSWSCAWLDSREACATCVKGHRSFPGKWRDGHCLPNKVPAVESCKLRAVPTSTSNQQFHLSISQY